MAEEIGGSRVHGAGRLLGLIGGAGLVVFGAVKLTRFIARKRELKKRIGELEGLCAKKEEEYMANRVALRDKRREIAELQKKIQEENRGWN